MAHWKRDQEFGVNRPNLASTMLHTLFFITMEWWSSDIQPAKVFHLACRILEEKIPPSSLIVAQATENLSTTEVPEEANIRQEKLATKAIAFFDLHALDGQEVTSSYDLPASASATYL